MYCIVSTIVFAFEINIYMSIIYRSPTHRLATIQERDQPTANQPTTSRYGLSHYASLRRIKRTKIKLVF